MRVLVVGSAGSGTGCTAGVLHRLGCHMGDHFHGQPHGAPRCGYEQESIRSAARRGDDHLALALREHYEWHEANHEVVGTKFGELANRPHLIQRVGIDRLVIVRRPRGDVEDSIRRQWAGRNDLDSALSHARRVADNLYMLHDYIPESMSFHFYDIVNFPKAEVERLSEFLDLEPSLDQIQSAVDWVRRPTIMSS